MSDATDTIVDRVKVREVAGVFDTPVELEAAVKSLLMADFDRADLDIMADVKTVGRKLGELYAPPQELADIPQVPRRAFVAREDTSLVTLSIAGILTYIGATAAALGVVASGGTLALAVAAAAAGGATAGGIGALIARAIGRKSAQELEEQLRAGGIVLWVRVRAPEREQAAQDILQRHGAKFVRVHEIEIGRRLRDLPLASLHLDPLLATRPDAAS